MYIYLYDEHPALLLSSPIPYSATPSQSRHPLLAELRPIGITQTPKQTCDLSYYKGDIFSAKYSILFYTTLYLFPWVACFGLW